MISYRPLWNTLKEHGISTYALINKYHISPGQITRLKHNEYVSTHTIEVFCKILGCNVINVLEYIADDVNECSKIDIKYEIKADKSLVADK